MKINGYKKEFMKVVTYRIEEVPEVGTVMYSDYYDDNDKIVDSVIRTEDGHLLFRTDDGYAGLTIEVPSVLEDIQNFIDTEFNTVTTSV